MKKLRVVFQQSLLIVAILVSPVSSLASSYVTIKDDKTNKVNSSTPIINVYIGNAKAEKELVVLNSWVAHCWNDKIIFALHGNIFGTFRNVTYNARNSCH